MRTNEEKMKQLALGYIKAVGGKENIKEIEACSTRIRIITCEKISLVLEDVEHLGAKYVMERNQNEVHIVVGIEAEEIVETIEGLQ